MRTFRGYRFVCIRNIHTLTLTWHFCAYADIVVRDILRDREYIVMAGREQFHIIYIIILLSCSSKIWVFIQKKHNKQLNIIAYLTANMNSSKNKTNKISQNNMLWWNTRLFAGLPWLCEKGRCIWRGGNFILYNIVEDILYDIQ